MTNRGGLVCLGLVLGLIVGAIGASVGGKLWASSPPVALLDADLLLRSEGTTYVFTTPGAGAVLLTVDLPDGCRQEAHVSVAPMYVAMRPDPVYEPGASEHVLEVPPSGLRSHQLELARQGAYVLRIEPIPMAMAHEGAPPRARVRVVWRP